MSKKITILPQIKIIKCLTPVEKQVASEIARFTDQGKWFFKSLENFALELKIKKGTLKNIYVKFTKLEWLEKNRIGRTFEYEMTKKFFNFVEESESKNDHIFANFSRKVMTSQLPNNDRLMTDKLPNNDQSMIKITYSSNTQAPNKVSNVLNNEGIKDLNNEGIKLEKEKEKSKNLTRQQNILNENLEALENFKKELFENLNQKDWIINKKSESQVWNEEKAKANLELIFDKIKVWMTENPKKLNENPKIKTRFNQFAEKSEIGWIYPIKITYQTANFNQNNTQFRQKLGNLTDEQAKEKYAGFYTEAKESVLLPSDPIEMYQRNYEHQFSD